MTQMYTKSSKPCFWEKHQDSSSVLNGQKLTNNSNKTDRPRVESKLVEVVWFDSNFSMIINYLMYIIYPKLVVITSTWLGAKMCQFRGFEKVKWLELTQTKMYYQFWSSICPYYHHISILYKSVLNYPLCISTAVNL